MADFNLDGLPELDDPSDNIFTYADLVGLEESNTVLATWLAKARVVVKAAQEYQAVRGDDTFIHSGGGAMPLRAAWLKLVATLADFDVQPDYEPWGALVAQKRSAKAQHTNNCREGCICEHWSKPCPFHKGWAEGYEYAKGEQRDEQESQRRHGAAPQP